MLTKARLFIVPIAMILFFAQSLLAPGRTGGGKIDVVFRYDDYSATSRTELEKGILGLFLKNRANLTVGVIPFVCQREMHDTSPQPELALTRDKIDLLKGAQEAGVVEVALHGYNHQTIQVQGRHYSEFKGIPFEAQNLKISLGKKFLEENFGGEVSTFIPPWNSYDRNTVLSAEQNHFKVLSGDFEGIADQNDTIQFIPATSDVYKARDAVRRARWNPGHVRQTVVILFHAYDFKEANPSAKYSLDELSDLVSWIASQEDVRFLSVRQAAQDAGPGNFNARKFLTYKKFHRMIPGLVLELMFPVGAFSSEPMTPLAMWRSMGVSVFIYCIILYLCFFMSFKNHLRLKAL